MNEEIKSIGIYSEDYKFESDYIPFISFKTHKQKDIIEDYIFTKANIFFYKILKFDSINIKSTYIKYPKTITEKDFKEKDIKYFYDNIFSNLGERDSNNRLDFSPKWGITFDEKCAPIEVSFLSPSFKVRPGSKPKFNPFDYYHHDEYKWNYKYGTIDINEKPVFYYIYFSLQELLDEIKKIS